jgi:hypothetical protein
MKVLAVFLTTESVLDQPPVAFFPASDRDKARTEAERYVATFYPGRSFELHEVEIPFLPPGPSQPQ